MCGRFAIVFVGWLVLGWTGYARAESALYTPYERAAIQRELVSREWEADPEPEGKLISEIEIVRLDVFDETDPVPDFVNVFHTISKEPVIRRELLFEEGERFSQRRADETARNLKGLMQLSLVLIVPVRDAEAGRVRLLVITKDVWSLRLNSNIQYGSEGLTYLLLNPVEANVAGTHASVGGLFVLKRSTYSIGGMASHGRILGTRLASSISANAVFNRDTNQTEGSFGGFTYGVPRYSERQRWYYGVGLEWDDAIVRVDVSEKDEPPLVLAYHREAYLGSTGVTRSFGLRHKVELRLGAEVDRRDYQSRVGPEVDPEEREEFEREDIPVSDTRISPFVQVSTFENRFMKTIELETLGLQEDFRLGPQAVLKIYGASTEVGSSRDLVGVLASLGYTQQLGDGLVRAIATSSIQAAKAEKHHALVTLKLRLATPRLGFGRLIWDGLLENRYQNYLNTQNALGGDGRLRGYAAGDTEAAGSAEQRGDDIVAFNTEFRTAGIDILSAQCGLAAFHDVGGVADSLDALVWKQSVGVGLRTLFPQADRIVFRLDWAFPLTEGYDTLPGTLFFTVGQAFLMPEL